MVINFGLWSSSRTVQIMIDHKLQPSHAPLDLRHLVYASSVPVQCSTLDSAIFA